MGTRIGKEKIEREKGYLYYIGKDGYVSRTPMAYTHKGKKSEKVGTEKTIKETGKMYYADKEGYVCEAPFNRKGRPKKKEKK